MARKMALDIQAQFDKLSTFADNISAAMSTYKKAAQDNLYERHVIIGNIVRYIKKELSKIPPSGAVAGIYARVDNARGVWKAPANESLNSVLGPSVNISHDQQANLNVDAVAGKSINAIRTFTGKGTLVWGARTLAGNDNEWRYVSVRRFFNMVEESTRNASEPFVFEPNDANTWIKVQAMIENFLTNLWRQGALQGPKPEHAFYVAVGLRQNYDRFRHSGRSNDCRNWDGGGSPGGVYHSPVLPQNGRVIIFTLNESTKWQHIPSQNSTFWSIGTAAKWASPK